MRETNGCGFGERVGSVAGEETTDSAASDGRTRSDGAEAPLYRGGTSSYHQVEFGDVPVERGDEVEFHVAGPSTSVYGTDSGTVTGLKTGIEDYHVLIIETDSGEKRVREDWLVDVEASSYLAVDRTLGERAVRRPSRPELLGTVTVHRSTAVRPSGDVQTVNRFRWDSLVVRDVIDGYRLQILRTS